MKIEKPQSDRIKECITILKKLTDEVGIPPENPSICVLKKRMGQYWRDGKGYEDSLPLVSSNRSIIYKLPKWSHQFVEVTLRVNKGSPVYPPDLEEELLKDSRSAAPTNQLPPSDPAAAPQDGMCSAMQSGPSHPSPPE